MKPLVPKTQRSVQQSTYNFGESLLGIETNKKNPQNYSANSYNFGESLLGIETEVVIATGAMLMMLTILENPY